MGIFVAMPTEGNVRIETVTSVLELITQADCEVQLAWRVDRPVDTCRNRLVEEFLESEHENLLFIDSDIVPPPGFWRLVDCPGDIVGAVCPIQLRGGKQTDTAVVTNIYDMVDERLVPMAKVESPDGGVVDVASVGMGLTLIRRHVIEAMTKPYFYMQQAHEGGLGEDMYFCLEARKKGFRVVADPSIFCDHIRITSLGDAYQQIHVFR